MLFFLSDLLDCLRNSNPLEFDDCSHTRATTPSKLNSTTAITPPTTGKTTTPTITTTTTTTSLHIITQQSGGSKSLAYQVI